MRFITFKKRRLKLTFQKGYFLAAVILFFTEVAIALFIRDQFLRPYGGDFLVILFLYCLLKSFFIIPVQNAIFAVLIFAFLLETLQYFQILEFFGLQDRMLLNIILGNHFEWLDLGIYTLAGIFLFVMERILIKNY